jgi:hypothetical protein
MRDNINSSKESENNPDEDGKAINTSEEDELDSTEYSEGDVEVRKDEVSQLLQETIELVKGSRKVDTDPIINASHDKCIQILEQLLTLNEFVNPSYEVQTSLEALEDALRAKLFEIIQLHNYNAFKSENKMSESSNTNL